MRDGDEYVINGSKTFITNGARADFIVLVTKTDPDAGYDGFSLFVVAKDTPGFHVSKKLEKLGMHSSDTAELTFEDVRVPAENLLGEEGKGFYHIMWELQGERLIGAAGSVAGAQRVFDKTLEYAKERNAFGRPIGRFQAIRHKFAEMATKIEAARQMVYTTAWRVQNGEYPVREISMAKLYASRIAVRGLRRVRPDPRRLRLHEGVRRRARVARHAAEPDRRRDRRDHARGHRPLVRPLSIEESRSPPDERLPAVVRGDAGAARPPVVRASFRELYERAHTRRATASRPCSTATSAARSPATGS